MLALPTPELETCPELVDAAEFEGEEVEEEEAEGLV